MNKKYIGYIPDIIDETHWILGSSTLSQIILRKDGQWIDYANKIKMEDQKKLIETYNCTGFNTLNAIEILFEEMFGAERNFSDRFTGISAGTYPPGNSAQIVCEAIRKTGVIKEEILPFDNSIATIDQYYSPKPLTKDLLSLGKQWLVQYGFGHEWVYNIASPSEKIKLLKQALQYSPLGVGVYAWEQTGELFTNKNNQQNSHWTCIVGYVEGKYWIIFDSYAPYIKHLDWNFPFGSAKRFSLTYLGIMDKTNDLIKNSSMIVNSEIYTPQQKVGLLKSILAFLKNYLPFLQ